MKLPEILIYDFDGVICDSVNIKTEAFVEMYHPYGKEIQEKVETYHLMHGGISRFEKFRYFESHLLGNKVTEAKINDLANRFSALVKEKVIAANYIPGALDFLIKNKQKRQFICTGTPENEILEIIKAKGIASCFDKIYGSPSSKSSIIKTILQYCNKSSDDCVFFGDAMTDYHAAKKCAVPFIGIKNDETQFPEKTILIEDFTKLNNQYEIH